MNAYSSRMVRSFRNSSIKVRLSVLILLASTLFSFGLFQAVHSTLHASLSRQQNEFAHDRLRMLRAIVERKQDFLRIIGEDIKWEGENISLPSYYLRLIDGRGSVLIETPGMKELVPIARFEAARNRTGSSEEIYQSPNGRYFLLKSDASSSAKRAVTMQIALDVTPEVTADAVNSRKIALLIIVSVWLLTAVLLVALDRTLRPLDRLVDFSGRISGVRISERVDCEVWPLEVRRLGEALNAMLDRLEDSLIRLTHVAANMAHEIRTPLNNLMGEAEVALMQARTPEEYQRVLESGMEECARLTRLVDNLLFLGHAENPAMSISRVRFDPLSEVKSLFGQFAVQAQGKEAQLGCRGDLFLYGDPMLFRRAISNLLANALYYSPPGVRIEVAIEAGDGEMNRVTVRDTGFGISETDLTRIFDRFYRGDHSRANYREGSGLGLSIVKAIMELHGGSVEVASRVGAGTTFTLLFPRPPELD
ncbi:heavy metal sensor histidine kinase [Geomesophilobacter sediminis]|uniref:histidine kinase n=1 Tax=Geomesophilobacter sediminis TaxID=2798584 RepID=A0A8J7LY61_9BACT|nr:heavy metal sensor histidine kinase [Geomesophilobacter sediminis]MBJ6724147.1 heavy metal sensor histidine kinase [Geomesophilobacter sediminis]